MLPNNVDCWYLTQRHWRYKAVAERIYSVVHPAYQFLSFLLHFPPFPFFPSTRPLFFFPVGQQKFPSQKSLHCTGGTLPPPPPRLLRRKIVHGCVCLTSENLTFYIFSSNFPPISRPRPTTERKAPKMVLFTMIGAYAQIHPFFM